MRTMPRLRGLKTWLFNELCKGRRMKAPSADGKYTEIIQQEPQVFIAWMPRRAGKTDMDETPPAAVVPSITIMPIQSHARYVESKRFDTYNNIHRPQEMGHELNVDILFSVFEPGVRLPGYLKEDGHIDPDKVTEGTEEGLAVLYDWMDECMEKLLGVVGIPGTDLSVDAEDMTYSLYMDQHFVVDRRPVFYGFVRVGFDGYAHSSPNREIEDML